MLCLRCHSGRLVILAQGFGSSRLLRWRERDRCRKCSRLSGIDRNNRLGAHCPLVRSLIAYWLRTVEARDRPSPSALLILLKRPSRHLEYR